MAAAIMCIEFNGNYFIEFNQKYDCTDELFLKIIENIIQRNKFNLLVDGLNMSGFYQHDKIYKIYKIQIIKFIHNNNHFIITDGINAGDKNCEKFFMIDIINTPLTFNKKYKNVLHVRLEDFVIHNLYLSVDRILNLLDTNIITDNLCIVCKKPETEFENNYIKTIINHIEGKMSVSLEHNDTITDYYIMKEAETLICSKSTLSWCAEFFSTNIKTCYLPNYDETPNSTCKYPIDNTILY